MTRGKKTCKILKEIRTQIAEKNDIEYVTSECGFQGECKGTCPKCEEEVRYLENELRKRQQLGKVVTIAGISLGVAGTFAACNNSAQQSDEKDSVKVAQYTPTSINTDSLVDVRPPICPTLSGVIESKYVPDYLGIPVLGEPYRPDELDSIELPKPPPEPERFPDIKAEYRGGMQALYKFLNENINYPQDALDASISGRVVVEFVVRADSTIGNVTVLKKVHPSLDEEAIRVVKSMPKWKPATSNGEAVASYFQLPVQFKMEKRKSEENAQKD